MNSRSEQTQFTGKRTVRLSLEIQGDWNTVTGPDATGLHCQSVALWNSDPVRRKKNCKSGFFRDIDFSRLDFFALGKMNRQDTIGIVCGYCVRID